MLTVVERVLASLRAQDRSGWLTRSRAQRAPASLLRDSRAPSTSARDALALSPAELDELRAAAPGIGFERWTRDDAARALLLIARRNSGRTGDAFVDDALGCFEQGDAREQQSWLRAVALLPEAGAFLPLAIDACRTNILPVFEARRVRESVSGAHFPGAQLQPAGAEGAVQRRRARAHRRTGRRGSTPSSSRMARDYAAERRAAGRIVPADIAPRHGRRRRQGLTR